VLAKLGAGGMGIVYAAYDPELDRKVALKMLLGEDSRDAEGRARLLREAQALAKFSHPEIVAIHDVGEHRGRLSRDGVRRGSHAGYLGQAAAASLARAARGNARGRAGCRGRPRIELANPLVTLGDIALLQNRPQDALVLVERAIAIWDDQESDLVYEFNARFLLARALLATGDRKRALTEAENARDGLTSAKVTDDLAEVEAWLAEHR
jgi:serine/threonine protein kinase